MKIRITVLSIIAVPLIISCAGENQKQKLGTSGHSTATYAFANSVCSCFDELENYKDFEQAYKKYDNCALSYLRQNPNRIEELIENLKILNDGPKSEYEKGYIIGKKIAKKGNLILLRNCESLRKSMIAIKSSFFEEANLDRKEIIETINQFESALEEKNDPDREVLGQVYFLLGVYNEMVSKIDEAKIYYKECAKIESSYNSISEIFGELINYKAKES